MLIPGIKEDQAEDWKKTEDKVRDFITTNLKIDFAGDHDKFEIERAHRIEPKKQKHARPIIVRFLRWKQRNMVLTQPRHLVGKSYSVVEDFSYPVREKRRLLYPTLKKARAEGKHANFSVDKMIVDGEYFVVNEEHKVVPQRPRRYDNVQ
jgi:hypothetical protein